MIYKFIDINGSEIVVNSLSNLQALVDSETIKENTKVKAGLRGKWTTASKIEELVFTKEEIGEPKETEIPKGDIKSFTTKDEKIKKVPVETKSEDLLSAQKPEETTTQPWQNNKPDKKAETIEDERDANIQEPALDEASVQEKSESELDENIDSETNGKENDVGLNLYQAVDVCFKKYFNFKDRASRSEFWYFFLFGIVGYAIGFGLMMISYKLFWLLIIFIIVLIIPFVAVATRRLHDINKSGWFQLIASPAGILEGIFYKQKGLELFFMIVGVCCSLYLFYLYIQVGDEKKNRFGKNPLKSIK